MRFVIYDGTRGQEAISRKVGTTCYTAQAHYTTDDVMVVVLTDEDKGMSITSNAKNVVEDLVPLFYHNVGNEPLVVYRDTDGVYDMIVVENGRFKNFLSLATKPAVAGRATLEAAPVFDVRMAVVRAVEILY